MIDTGLRLRSYPFALEVARLPQWERDGRIGLVLHDRK